MGVSSDPQPYHGNGTGVPPSNAPPLMNQGVSAVSQPFATQQVLYPYGDMRYDQYNIVDDLLYHVSEIASCGGDYVRAREHFERVDMVVKNCFSNKDSKTIHKWFLELQQREKELERMQNMDQLRLVKFLSAVLSFSERNEVMQLRMMRELAKDANTPLAMKCIVHYMMARVLHKRPQEAIQTVQDGLNLVSGNFPILLGLLGHLQWRNNGDKQGALSNWARALQLDPTYGVLRLSNAATASNEMQEFLLAAREYEHISLRYPANVEWGIRAADLYVRYAQQIGNSTGNEIEMQGNYDAALRILYTVIQRFPGRSNIHENLARTHWAMAVLRSMPAPQAAVHYERTIDNFQQAYRFDPSNMNSNESYRIALQEYHDYCRSHGIPPTRFATGQQGIPPQTSAVLSPQVFSNQHVAENANAIPLSVDPVVIPPSPSPLSSPTGPNHRPIPRSYGNKDPKGILIHRHFKSASHHTLLAFTMFLFALIPFPPISLLFTFLMGSTVLGMPVSYVLLDSLFAFFPFFNIVVAISHIRYFFAARRVPSEESDRLVDLRRASAEPKYVPLLVILCVLSTPGLIFGLIANALIIYFCLRRDDLDSEKTAIIALLSFLPFVSLIIAIYYSLHFGRKQKMSKLEGRFITWDEYWHCKPEFIVDPNCPSCNSSLCSYQPNYYRGGYSHWSYSSADDCFWCCFWCFMWSNYSRPYPHQPPLCNCVVEDPAACNSCNDCHVEPMSCEMGEICLTCNAIDLGGSACEKGCGEGCATICEPGCNEITHCRGDLGCGSCDVGGLCEGDCSPGNCDCNLGDCDCNLGDCDCNIGDCGNLDCNIN